MNIWTGLDRWAGVLCSFSCLAVCMANRRAAMCVCDRHELLLLLGVLFVVYTHVPCLFTLPTNPATAAKPSHSVFVRPELLLLM